MTTFASVGDAVRAGWTVYDRTNDGYLIKQFFVGAGWKIGRVVIPRPQEAMRESNRAR